MSDQDPINRRRFFRAGLGELLKPLFQAVEPIHEIARQIGNLEPQIDGVTPARKEISSRWLRPPGALAEAEFLDTCSRCGECVKVCPAQCIKIDARGTMGEGAPYIQPSEMPCVLCDGLKCMHVCPTGALVPTILDQVDMGTAFWNESICVRSRGEDCTICIDHCPVGTAALELVDGKVKVHEDGCSGCGVCQHRCPTDPKSIIVIPKAARR